MKIASSGILVSLSQMGARRSDPRPFPKSSLGLPASPRRDESGDRRENRVCSEDYVASRINLT